MIDDNSRKGIFKGESEQSEQKDARMPEDFWKLVQTARSRAQAEVEKKREKVYQAFITEEVRSGKRIPMPNGFWQAVDGSIGSAPEPQRQPKQEEEKQILPSIQVSPVLEVSASVAVQTAPIAQAGNYFSFNPERREL